MFALFAAIQIYEPCSLYYFSDCIIKWRSVDVTLKSKHNSPRWKEDVIKKSIIQKCYLWETYSDYLCEMSREHGETRKEEIV